MIDSHVWLACYTDIMLWESGRRSRFRRALLTWYAREHRKLPWRAPVGQLGQPYHVLVSEAMLQQTQVATVVDYFNRFTEELPTVQALAAADEQQVLRLWQGLGYYRRARNLHRAAQIIVDDHGGELPHTLEGLLSLPGVGRYSAGAIGSIALGLAEPVVDGNVMRVLARLFGIDTPTDAPATQKHMWEIATTLVPRRNNFPGDFNQAMMELGAVVCLPRGPKCAQCPVKRYCTAQAEGRTEELPVAPQRKKPKPVTHHVLALHRDGRYVFRRRGDEGLWVGLWEMPTSECGVRNVECGMAEALGLTCDTPVNIGSFMHITTHRLITFQVHRAEMTGGKLTQGAGKWRGLDDVDDLPLANPQCKVIRMLQAHDAR